MLFFLLANAAFLMTELAHQKQLRKAKTEEKPVKDEQSSFVKQVAAQKTPEPKKHEVSHDARQEEE